MYINKAFLFIMLCSLVLVSCTKDEKEKEEELENGITFTSQGSLTFRIDDVFGDTTFALEPSKHITAGAKDTISVSQLSYYMSNIVLTKTDGSKVKLNENHYTLLSSVTDGYHFVSLPQVPAGTYTDISYLIGVDSLRNHTGAQDGDLDPSLGMFWTWNTGYVFFRIKGRYSDNKSFSLDIGGDKNIMTVKKGLTAYKISGTDITLRMKFDASKVFTAKNTYDLKMDADEIHSPTSPSLPKLTENISDAFTITGVQ